MAFVRLGLRPSLAAAVMAACVFFCGSAQGQAVAEAAGATSVAAGTSTAMKPIQLPKIPTAAAGAAASAMQGGSPHLIASAGPAPQETNLRDFQARAGKDAGKVLLRATPVEASVWVNGKIVGKTPLLLVLAPGKYEVEMRGAKGQTGNRTMDLLPHETREVLVTLHQLYPGRVTAQR